MIVKYFKIIYKKVTSCTFTLWDFIFLLHRSGAQTYRISVCSSVCVCLRKCVLIVTPGQLSNRQPIFPKRCGKLSFELFHMLNFNTPSSSEVWTDRIKGGERVAMGSLHCQLSFFFFVHIIFPQILNFTRTLNRYNLWKGNPACNLIHKYTHSFSKCSYKAACVNQGTEKQFHISPSDLISWLLHI